MDRSSALGLVLLELERLNKSHERFNSYAEAAAFVGFAADKLWDASKDGSSAEEVQAAAVTVAAMGLRWLIDLGIGKDGAS